MNNKNQHGLSLVSVLFFIIVFGSALLFAAAVLPSYINNQAVVGSLKQLADEPNLDEMTLSEFRSRLQKALSLNSVNEKARKALSVQRKRSGEGGFVATIQYENRENLFLNIDIVTSYHNVLDTKAPELCCKPITND